jgi:uncharacterized phage protein (TIGR02218 family)
VRTLPAALEEALSRDVLTLAMLYTITRTDGLVVRLAGHDRDLKVGSVVWSAAASLDQSSYEQAQGLGTTSTSLTGALSSDAFTDADLIAGRWIGARVSVAVTDWTAPTFAFELWSGRIAASTRKDQAFEIALEGIEAAFARTIGRRFTRQCDARLGDARCGIDLSSDSRFQANVTLAGVTGDRAISTAVPSGLLHARLKAGTIRFSSGPLAGLTFAIEDVRAETATLALTLAAPMPVMPSAGDTAIISIACDGALGTCRDVFANVINFRGCPHMPGDNASFAGPDTDLSSGAA